ncbi:hypothetical protein [Bacillus chungangensis]|uniref:Uncharacterized protein n=1 Tax=Bacillus chungangensis TaxID=587633 RepID=A0ABT9WNB5_9BACI|nr:hypothetical protein [Bacillus chungangensis]MDQ0174452.1 hypothetical protein [Bacillus chungangensis]
MAKHYTEVPVEKWNTRHFTDYLCEEHQRLFGVEYVPYASWRREQGQIANIIGTTKRKGTHDAPTLKRFIDECFSTFTPSEKYAGINFSFMWTYRKALWQRILADKAKQTKIERTETTQEDLKELAEWL